MCGVRKLTRAAYANQRMTLYGKLRQRFKSKRNTMIALRVSFTRGVFHHSCFSRAFGDAFYKTWMSWDTPLYFPEAWRASFRCEGTPLSFLRQVVGPRLMEAREGEMKRLWSDI